MCFMYSMGSNYMWTIRKPWSAQRLPMTGLLSPAPASSQEQAQSVYLVSKLNQIPDLCKLVYEIFFSFFNWKSLKKLCSIFLSDVCAYLFVLKESQSHSSQADSGMSDGTSSSHARSQSVVSSIFSEAWKRGTQIEESTRVSCPSFSGEIHLFT